MLMHLFRHEPPSSPRAVLMPHRAVSQDVTVLRQAWLGAHLGMATAMRVLDAGVPGVHSSQDACRLLERALQESHRQLMTVRGRPKQQTSVSHTSHACYHRCISHYCNNVGHKVPPRLRKHVCIHAGSATWC